MECVICGKGCERVEGFNFCTKCGVELIDDEREGELGRRLQEVTAAREALEKQRAEGQIGDAAYCPIASTLAKDSQQGEAELEAIEQKRKRLRAEWVYKMLDNAEQMLGQGNLESASAAAQKVIQFDPTNTATHMTMARILNSQGRLEDAIWAARYAQGLDPSNIQIEEYVGQLELLYQGKPQTGVKQLFA